MYAFTSSLIIDPLHNSTKCVCVCVHVLCWLSPCLFLATGERPTLATWSWLTISVLDMNTHACGYTLTHRLRHWHTELRTWTDKLTDLRTDRRLEGKSSGWERAKYIYIKKRIKAKMQRKKERDRETKSHLCVAMATSRGVCLCVCVRGCHGNGHPLTLRSLCTISCWWIWLTLSKIWLMQWLRREKRGQTGRKMCQSLLFITITCTPHDPSARLLQAWWIMVWS